MEDIVSRGGDGEWKFSEAGGLQEMGQEFFKGEMGDVGRVGGGVYRREDWRGLREGHQR